MEESPRFGEMSKVLRGVLLAASCACMGACGSSMQPVSNAGSSSTNAQAAVTPRPRYAETDAEYYRARAGALATEAIDQIAGTDFWRFRRGRLYVPDASNIQELEERLADAAKSDSAAGIIDASAAVLAADQADINAHTLRSNALRRTDHITEADFHRTVAQGLIDSIIHAGNGLNPDSAWTVYRVKEEYEVLKARRARFVSQSRVNVGNRTLDLLDAEEADGKQLHVYFDVTELLAEQARALR
jgi:hypothetical protein